jgi:hypothetical protein
MRKLAVVTDYADLVRALRDRAQALDVNRLDLDEAAGLPAGYSGKVLGPAMVKSLGRVSLGTLLGALGLALVVVEVDRPRRLPKRKIPYPLRPMPRADSAVPADSLAALPAPLQSQI